MSYGVCIVYCHVYILCTVYDVTYVYIMFALSVCVMCEVGNMDACVLWDVCCVSYWGSFSTALSLSGCPLTGVAL